MRILDYGDESYCPYDVVNTPAPYRLQTCAETTQFGVMHTVRTANPSSSTVRLFLHGVGGNWASWTPLFEHWRRNNVDPGDCILIDLPGFGASRNTAGSLDATALGDELLRLVERGGWSRVHLIGHSMGGFLALDMASRRPAGVRSVTAISGAYFGIVDVVNSPFASLRTNPQTAVTYLSMAALSLLGPLGQPLLRLAGQTGLLPRILTRTAARPGELRPSVVAALADNLRPRAFRMAAENGKSYDCASRWADITVPVIACAGAADSLVTAADLRRLAAVVPRSSTVVLNDTGHFGPVERPQLVAELLSDPRTSG